MHVLRLHCLDQPGIVAAVATALANAQCNIEESSQFYDPFSGRFFMRVVFRGLTHTALSNFESHFLISAQKFAMDWEIRSLDMPVKSLILVSKADHCLQDLLYRWRTKSVMIDPVAIVSNHPDLKPLAQQNNLPFHHLPITPKTKESQEQALDTLVQATGAELILLARYMQVLSQQICSKYLGRIINIHHSFLPGFKGAKPYTQAYERGVKIIGATAHFVTPDLDEGPIIAQDVEPVTHAHSPEKMQHIGKDIETKVLAEAVRLYTERRIFLHGPRTVIL
jgi:formyltetrahydrofolate deformylase